MEERREMTVREAGKKGGETVKRKYGAGYYAEIGKKGGQSVKAKHGPDYYARIGRKGGSAKKRPS